jgi:hypothetical protein
MRGSQQSRPRTACRRPGSDGFDLRQGFRNAAKHKRHGVNVQVIADAHGRLVWPSAALPGSVHDLTAARTHGVIAALTAAAVATFADKGYRGAPGAVGVPFYGRNLPKRLRECNAGHAKVRAIGEPAIATLKSWKLVAKLRCCPQLATALTQAILVLQHLEDARR